MNKQTILIVDDDLQNLQVLGNILRENKFNVAAATSGFMALDYIHEALPDLIILDVMMPDMDGFETCKIMKSLPEMEPVPILFLSALTDVNEMVKGLESGAFDYIFKPINSSLLLSKIQLHLDLKSKTEELGNLNKELEDKIRERTLQLEKANQELKKLDEAKTEFLQIISHEIRTPLNGILGFTSIIKNECGNGKVAGYVKHLDLSVKRLERFALNALLYTQLNTGKYKLKPEEVDFADLIRSILPEFEDMLASYNISTSLALSENSIIQADRNLLTECIKSILTNAIMHSHPQTWIEIKTFTDNNKMICKITDQGKGFSEKALNNLFQLFKPGNVFVDQNDGIELAICKLIMNAHQGDIRAFNYGSGATVELLF